MRSVSTKRRKSAGSRPARRTARPHRAGLRSTEAEPQPLGYPFSIGGAPLCEIESPSTVLVSIPAYRCRDTVRQAVQSMLDQRGVDVLVVVTEDADPDRSTRALDKLEDPRLITARADKNGGPYRIHDGVLRAGARAGMDLFAVQDADDYSISSRFVGLLGYAMANPCDAVFSGYTNLYPGDRRTRVSPRHVPHRGRLEKFSHITAHATGLYRIGALMRIGGYYSGHRVSYDTALMSALCRMGRCGFLPRSTYVRRIVETSLTQRSDTGMQSPVRARAHRDHLSMINAAESSSGTSARAYARMIEKRASGSRLGEAWIDRLASQIRDRLDG